MIIKIDVWPDVFARLIKAVRQDGKFQAAFVFEREGAIEFFGTGGGKSLVAFLKDTKVSLDTGKISVTLEVSEIFGASEELLDVPRTVPDTLFDILGIFPREGRADDGERQKAIDEIKERVRDIYGVARSATPGEQDTRFRLDNALTDIDRLLDSLRKS